MRIRPLCATGSFAAGTHPVSLHMRTGGSTGGVTPACIQLANDLAMAKLWVLVR
jgi:hypothetical protein